MRQMIYVRSLAQGIEVLTWPLALLRHSFAGQIAPRRTDDPPPRPLLPFEYNVVVVPGPTSADDFPRDRVGDGYGVSIPPDIAVLLDWLDSSFGDEWLRALAGHGGNDEASLDEGYPGGWWVTRSAQVSWRNGGVYYYRTGGADHQHDVGHSGRVLAPLDERVRLAWGVCRLALQAISVRRRRSEAFPASALRATTILTARASIALMVREELLTRPPPALLQSHDEGGEGVRRAPDYIADGGRGRSRSARRSSARQGGA